MTQLLAVTALGTDRPGIVNELAKLTTRCECDVIDSRVASFGSEFSLIMLISGTHAAITRMENELPMAAAQLDLLTISKRTSEHKTISVASKLMVEFFGEDKRGTMRQITQFIADKNLDLGGFSSRSRQTPSGLAKQHLEVRINLTAEIDSDHLEDELRLLAEQMRLDCRIQRLESQQSE